MKTGFLHNVVRDAKLKAHPGVLPGPAGFARDEAFTGGIQRLVRVSCG